MTDEDIPKIGRGPLKTLLPMKALVRIFAMIICLVAIIALRKSCATGVSNFVMGFSPPDAGVPRPTVHFVLTPDGGLRVEPGPGGTPSP